MSIAAAPIRRTIVTAAPNRSRVVDVDGGERFLLVAGPDGIFAWPVRGNEQGPFATPAEAEQHLTEQAEGSR